MAYFKFTKKIMAGDDITASDTFYNVIGKNFSAGRLIRHPEAPDVSFMPFTNDIVESIRSGDVGKMNNHGEVMDSRKTERTEETDIAYTLFICRRRIAQNVLDSLDNIINIREIS